MDSRTNRSDERLKDAYFKWLCNMVCDEDHANYICLLNRLFLIRFRCFLKNDQNRIGDGLYLHHIFAIEYGYTDKEVDDILGNTFDDCTVLEVIIGIAKRIGDILWDPEEGDRIKKWFWIMIYNLGLDDCRDEDFDEECVERIDHWIDNLMTRHYSADGFGGLFPLKNPKTDQRNVEIWYQMQAWCIENYGYFL